MQVGFRTGSTVCENRLLVKKNPTTQNIVDVISKGDKN